MEIKGKVIQVMEVVTGQSSKGQWSKQDFIMETGDKYPKKVCITLWGQENIDKYDLVAGMTVTAFLELDSREYQGKWFTNVRAWKIQWDEQKRPDFPKKETPVAKEQEWPERTVEKAEVWLPDKTTPSDYPSDKKDIDVSDLPF